MKVRHHAASTLIVPSSFDRVLVGIYDSRYPLEVFRRNYNFVGGNSKNDHSPYDTLIRQITNEFREKPLEKSDTIGAIIGSKEADKEENTYLINRSYAPSDMLVTLRNKVLDNAVPFHDYLIKIKKDYVKTPEDLYFIITAYISKIDDVLFEKIESELSEGRQITNEGIASIVTYDRLVRGMLRGAWGYASIASDMLDLPISEQSFITVSKLGKPKNSYKEYKKDFEYQRDPEL